MTKKKKQTRYEEIQALKDDKINVLLAGASGCGKSTLINAILGSSQAPEGAGIATTEIGIYQNEQLPFRMIDTVGYEYSFLKQYRIRRELARFSRSGIRTKDTAKLIHMIWFCIDGTSRRIDDRVLDSLADITKDWKNVPILVVLTKSYSQLDAQENQEMVSQHIWHYNEKHRHHPLQVKDIIPVVAKAYPVDTTTIVYPYGLDVLTAKTEELAGQSKETAAHSVKELDLKMKRTLCYSIVAASTAAATTIGAVPITTPDAAILYPLQSGMLWAIAKVYGLNKKNTSNEIIESIIRAGGTTIAGKTALNVLKSIPGINLAASVLNAAVAGSITLIAGKICMNTFEKVYTGQVDERSVDWDTEIAGLFQKYLPKVLKKVEKLMKENDGRITVQQIVDVLKSMTKLK